MKLKTALLFLILAAQQIFCNYNALATVYYVSFINGNDSWDGTSQIYTAPNHGPWKTIQRVNSQSLVTGDKVLFKRGEIWTATNGYGTASQLNLKSGVIYSAYSTGAKPVISGATEISATGWTLSSGSIYKKFIASGTNPSKFLFFNERLLVPARWPNYNTSSYGWTNADSVHDIGGNRFNYLRHSVLHTLFPSSSGLIGAVVTANDPFSLESRQITSYDPGTDRIYFNNVSSYISKVDFGDNPGYYLSNALIFLDSPGEWYFNATDSCLYVWFPYGNAPLPSDKILWSTKSVGASVVNGNETSFSITDIEFRHHTMRGLYLAQCKNALIRNCDFINTKTGIQGSGSYSSGFTQSTLIDSCTFIDIIYQAISAGAFKNCSITNNTIRRIGMIAGLGQAIGNEFWSTEEGIDFLGGSEGNLIQYNTIDSCGRFAICIARNKRQHVVNNIIDHTCLNFDDCGAIYCGGNADTTITPPGNTMVNNVIEYNIIKNSLGNFWGTWREHAKTLTGRGIYPDVSYYCADTIRNNTVIGCSEGIFVNRNSHEYYSDNTVYNSSVCQMYITRSIPSVRSSNVIRNNTLFSLAANAPALLWENSCSPACYDDTNFFHGNRYWNIFQQKPIATNNDIGVTTYKDWWNIGRYDHAEWYAGGYDEGVQQGWTCPDYYEPYQVANWGSNYVSNSTFTGGSLTGWSGFLVSGPAAYNHDSLGECLSFMQSTGPYGMVSIGLQGNFYQDSTYVLNFSVIASAPTNLCVDVHKNTSNIGFFRAYNVGNYRQDIIACFKAVNGYPNPNLHFFTNDDTLQRPYIYIDNVTLFPAHLTYTDPRPNFPIFVNETHHTQQFSLGGYAHLDLDSNLITDPCITLPPFTSKILIRTNLSTIGMHQNKREYSLAIYPNPVTDQVNVEVPGNSVIEIHNVPGQIVMTAYASEKRKVIDVSALPPGMYIVKTKYEAGLLTGKFIKK